MKLLLVLSMFTMSFATMAHSHSVHSNYYKRVVKVEKKCCKKSEKCSVAKKKCCKKDKKCALKCGKKKCSSAKKCSKCSVEKKKCCKKSKKCAVKAKKCSKNKKCCKSGKCGLKGKK